MRSLLLLLILSGFLHADPAAEVIRKYWKQSAGEITRYALTQSRYGELHQGDAVLIFVTEPFSASKQVKLDHWETAGDDFVNVLKLNYTKKFLTGIYPYSLMMSTFTPMDAAPTLKVTMSGQEWCGHVYTQLNLRDAHYETVGFSYFESEGDTHVSLPAVALEDGLWSQIRLRPDQLPVGKFSMIPGTLISRLTHVPLRPEQAEGAFFEPKPEDFNPATSRGYRLHYLSGTPRTLEIYFEKTPPYPILGWDDTYPEFGGAPLTTTARRTDSLMLPYWQHHLDADRSLRSKLGLSPDR